MSSAIEINTLGELHIHQNGQLVDGFISTKAALLFVYLAMHPGEHTRKKLSAMFWSETNDHQALKNLRTVLSSVRQTVPDAVIVLHDTLAINPAVAVQVDAVLFEEGCSTAFDSPAMPDLLTYMRQLSELYQGAFLANVPFRDADLLSEWVTEKQRYFQQLHVKLLHEIIELAQNQRDYDTGVHYARQLVRLDPYWDSARRQLMRLLAYTNRSNEALQQYEDFARLLMEDLAAVPEADTTTLYQQIRSREIHIPQPSTQSSIVLPDIPFVEAVEDIALAHRMLNTPHCRLLTIYGISGIGKTALATYVAFQRQNMYQDGAYFVPLRSAQSARDLPYLIASALGVDYANQTDAHQLEQIILDFLKHHHLLLVLDNYEHLLPEIGFVQQILEQTSQVQVIITSQLSLNLFREWLLPLHGLHVPSLDETQPETCEAVKLFEMAAQRVNPRFNLQENIRGVVEICQLVDGLPLALIIAAGWTQVAPIHKIIEYLGQGQEFALPVQHDLPPHHQSMEIMLDYTWDTLQEAEQYALTAMSIFNASFDMDEVEQICAVPVEVLTTIIRKSLVQKYGDKYRMHQMIWRYARKKLLYSDQKEVLGQRYMNFVVRLLTDLQKQRLPLHEHLLAIEIHYSRIWNYDWMAKSFQPVYILVLSRFLIAYWEISRADELPTIQKIIESMQGNELPAEARMLLRIQLARLHIRQNQQEQAYTHIVFALHENMIDVSWADWAALFNLCKPLLKFMLPDSLRDTSAQTSSDETILIDSYLRLLTLYLDMCDYEAAEGFFAYLLDSVDHPLDRALVLTTWGAVAAETEKFSAAFAHFSSALEYLQSIDQPIFKLTLHTLLMRVAHLQADKLTAYQHHQQALQLAIELKAEAAQAQITTFARFISDTSQAEKINS
jgi:DNA-binding SARP family transcriptional activator